MAVDSVVGGAPVPVSIPNASPPRLADPAHSHHLSPQPSRAVQASASPQLPFPRKVRFFGAQDNAARAQYSYVLIDTEDHVFYRFCRCRSCLVQAQRAN